MQFALLIYLTVGVLSVPVPVLEQLGAKVDKGADYLGRSLIGFANNMINEPVKTTKSTMVRAKSGISNFGQRIDDSKPEFNNAISNFKSGIRTIWKGSKQERSAGETHSTPGRP